MDAVALAQSSRTAQASQSLAQLSADSSRQSLSLHSSMDKMAEQLAALRTGMAARVEHEAALVMRLTSVADQLDGRSLAGEEAAAELRGIATGMSADLRATSEQVSRLSQDLAAVCKDHKLAQVGAAASCMCGSSHVQCWTNTCILMACP